MLNIGATFGSGNSLVLKLSFFPKRCGWYSFLIYRMKIYVFYRTDDTNMVHHLYACVCAHVQIDMVAPIQKVLRCIYGEQLGHELDGQEENGRQRQNF